MDELGIIREFKTKNFSVVVDAIEDYHRDISHDETNETQDNLNSGKWVIFCARVRVFYKGEEVGSDYLGNCIYESYDAFQDHRQVGAQMRELRKKDSKAVVGSYFHQMIVQAIDSARDHFAAYQLPYIRGVD